MSHLLHQFRWLVRRRWTLLAVHSLLWFVVTWLVWALPATAGWNDDFCFHVHVVLLTMTGLLAFESGGADPATGTNTFWRTRPPRWRAVWLGNVMFVIPALAGPVLICWTVNGLMLDLTAAQWRTGLAEFACIVSALMVLAALRSMAHGWTAIVVTLGVAAGFISAGATLLNHAGSELMNSLTGWQQQYSLNAVARNAYRDAFLLVACIVPVAAIVSVWAATMRRSVPRFVIISAAVWIVAAPALVWVLIREGFITRLQLVASVPGETTAPGERLLGVVKLRDVPDDLDVEVFADDLTAGLTGADEIKRSRDRHRLHISGRSRSAPAWLTPGAGRRLRSGFSTSTRWYSDGTGESAGLNFALKQWTSSQPMPVRLLGSVVGNLFRPAQGFAVKLENGSSAAGNGSRLRIRNVTAGSRNLEIECDIWESRTVSEWNRKSMKSLFVLHLPAVPAALVLSEEGDLPFRSLQCASRRIILRISMPDAEMVCGTRFTTKNLASAELWHIVPGGKLLFIARPEEDEVLLYPGSSPPISE